MRPARWYLPSCEQGMKGRRQALSSARPAGSGRETGMSQRRGGSLGVSSGLLHWDELCFRALGEPPRARGPPTSEPLT